MSLPPIFKELGINPGNAWGSVSGEPRRLIDGGYIPPAPAPSSSDRVYWGGLGDDSSGIDPKKLKILAIGGAVALLALYLIFRKRK